MNRGAGPAGSGPGAGLAITLVDDDPDQLVLCQRALERHAGIALAITSYVDPLQALARLCAAAAPALIVLDVHMQPMNGPQLVRRLRACRGFDSVAIVMLSSSEEPDDIAASTAAGASGYFFKPGAASGWADVTARLIAACGAGQPRQPDRAH